MICYNINYIIKRMFLTLRKSKLETLGVFRFYVKEKEVITPKGEVDGHYILYLETEDEKYGGMLKVTQKEHIKAIIGEFFGVCTLLTHEKMKDYYIIVNNSIPELALKEVVRESKIYLTIFIIAILGISIAIIQLIAAIFI